MILNIVSSISTKINTTVKPLYLELYESEKKIGDPWIGDTEDKRLGRTNHFNLVFETQELNFS
jgi:hypothetical protein